MPSELVPFLLHGSPPRNQVAGLLAALPHICHNTGVLVARSPTRFLDEFVNRLFSVSVIKYFYGVRGLAARPTKKLDRGTSDCHLVRPLPFDLPAMVRPVGGDPDGIVLRVIEAHKLPHHDKVVVQGGGIKAQSILYGARFVATIFNF